MMGFEFANYCNSYLQKHGLATRTISKIDSNPAKSKHLETATTKLFDQEIDFCNLRTEIYTEDSRIPSEVTFGTPSEDAYRRDTTINSLFYNINTETVEDFTNQGLSDLSLGLIRTPLAPYETFRDDPLRVLRCIRFASRFGFDMVPELLEAAKDESIKDALVNKISKERIGTEIDKMLSGPSPLLSLQLIHQCGLYSTVFEAPTILSSPPDDASQAVRAAGVVQWLLLDQCNLSSLSPNTISTTSSSSSSSVRNTATKDEKRILYLGATLLPYLSVMSEFKKRPIPAVQLVLRDSLKSTNHDVNTISTLYRGIPLLQQAVKQLDEQQTISRSDLGMMIRDIGSLWQTCLKLSLVHDLLSTLTNVTWDRSETLDANLNASATVIVDRYQRLLTLAYQYNIQDAHSWKPMMDGKKTTQLLGLKPGPVVQQLLKVMMIWQLEHPEGTLDECATMMKSYWDEKKQQQS
ncbi:uncharacterized protein BX664DRAFT_270349 [Halteromyces radiatus]|uniref:uncharacterized protein n=1 Tax=Halteromyces radiatus TaxID=101107 RepID=UPI00221ED29E|nr:uncharacterized protein BX664DRAFT_270349 [Halteromyces radiatus]KAI8077785.1 hypothetical protein BX664DRAFT_270349 [Halteromyces radiatus]